MKYFIIIAVAILAIIFGPFLTIWALNTLFHTNIEYALETWAAVIVIHASIRGLLYKENK